MPSLGGSRNSCLEKSVWWPHFTRKPASYIGSKRNDIAITEDTKDSKCKSMGEALPYTSFLCFVASLCHHWGPPRKGGVFPCSLWKFTVVPWFLKNKLRCSPKFIFTEFPCSKKFRSMFRWSPKIFLTVRYKNKIFDLSPRQGPKNERNCNTLPIFCRRKGLFPWYTLKKFFQWPGNQCSLVLDYNSTVPLFPKSKWSCSLVP